MEPFFGSYKNKELIKCENKYCGFCSHKGLIGHLTTISIEYNITDASGILSNSRDDTWSSKRQVIDAYWCPKCNKPLLPSEIDDEPK